MNDSAVKLSDRELEIATVAGETNTIGKQKEKKLMKFNQTMNEISSQRKN